MGSQYIGDTTVKIYSDQGLKQEIKNKWGILIRFWGIYRYFTLIDSVFGIFISENGKFSTGFSTFSTMEEVDG